MKIKELRSKLEALNIDIPQNTLKRWAGEGVIPKPIPPKGAGRGRAANWPKKAVAEAAAVWAVRHKRVEKPLSIAACTEARERIHASQSEGKSHYHFSPAVAKELAERRKDKGYVPKKLEEVRKEFKKIRIPAEVKKEIGVDRNGHTFETYSPRQYLGPSVNDIRRMAARFYANGTVELIFPQLHFQIGRRSKIPLSAIEIKFSQDEREHELLRTWVLAREKAVNEWPIDKPALVRLLFACTHYPATRYYEVTYGDETVIESDESWDFRFLHSELFDAKADEIEIYENGVDIRKTMLNSISIV